MQGELKMSDHTYVLYWQHGKKEHVQGDCIANAMTSAGYGAGAVSALDFFSDVQDEDDWEWNTDVYNWVWTASKKAKEIDVK